MTRELLDIKETDRYLCRYSSSTPWKGAKPHYPPDTRITIKDMRLKVDLRRLKEKIAEIDLALTVNAFGGDIEELVFDAIDLEFLSITCDGKPVEHQLSENKLGLNHRIQKNQDSKVEFKYRVENPLSGLHFISPLPHQPNRPYQVWTQGETEEMRYWLPLIDSPSHIFTCKTEYRHSLVCRYKQNEYNDD